MYAAEDVMEWDEDGLSPLVSNSAYDAEAPEQVLSRNPVRAPGAIRDPGYTYTARPPGSAHWQTSSDYQMDERPYLEDPVLSGITLEPELEDGSLTSDESEWFHPPPGSTQINGPTVWDSFWSTPASTLGSGLIV